MSQLTRTSYTVCVDCYTRANEKAPEVFILPSSVFFQERRTWKCILGNLIDAKEAPPTDCMSRFQHAAEQFRKDLQDREEPKNT